MLRAEESRTKVRVFSSDCLFYRGGHALPIEIEVDTIDQLKVVMDRDPDLILLDNMSPVQCREAVQLVDGKFRLEASGGITFDNARAYAQTGVDYIAVGALTHSAKSLDIGLDLKMES